MLASLRIVAEILWIKNTIRKCILTIFRADGQNEYTKGFFLNEGILPLLLVMWTCPAGHQKNYRRLDYFSLQDPLEIEALLVLKRFE